MDMQDNGEREMNGYVAPGFEQLGETFANGANDFGLGGGAFCAYVKGQRVADLWAGDARPGVPWSQDTITALASATKGLSALCAHVLYDRGLLDINAPVAKYWPEFAKAGKQDALVRHVLSHTVGVLSFPDPGSLLDWEGGGWDQYEEIAARLAAAEPVWQPGARVGYHGVSCGWLTGELVRRITGKTIGTFFREEIAVPLGLDLWIGTPPEEQLRQAETVAAETQGLPGDLLAFDRMLREHRNNPQTLMAQLAIHMHGSTIIDNAVDFLNNPRVRELEIAAGNGSGNARSLARMYAMLSEGGSLNGVRIVSPESVKVFRAEQAVGPSAVSPEFRLPSGAVVQPPITRYALGYALNVIGDFRSSPSPTRGVVAPGQPGVFGPALEAFGHPGGGGQIGFADPVNRVAVGYVRSQFALLPKFGNMLIDQLYACMRNARV